MEQNAKTKFIMIGGEKDGSEISITNNASVMRSLSDVKRRAFYNREFTEVINDFKLYNILICNDKLVLFILNESSE